MADLERVLIETEDFLMRQLGSRTAREANARRVKRGAAEAFRRTRRAALIFVLMLFGLVIADVAGAEIGFFTWLVALPGLILLSMISLAWPTRARRGGRIAAGGRQGNSALPLDLLAARCEEGLLERCDELPRAALPSADIIIARLRDLQPHLADMPEHDSTAGEARRLIGEHLPRLVDSYTDLSPRLRGPGSENDERIAESLAIVADELTRICGQVDGCRITQFETQRRFIETRYRADHEFRSD